MGSDDALFTVDELATASGLPVRTVRHYQSEKLLPPPERQGRIALYRQEHLDRLELISRLQDRGLRLSAIRDAFKRVEKGELWLDDWLGVGDQLRAPWSEERPVVLTEDELSQRLDHPPGTVAALVASGIARRQGGLRPSYLVPSPAALDITLELDAAGVDIDTASEAAAIMRKHLRRASEDLVEHFRKRAGAGFARRGSAQDIAEALDALRPLGARAVQLVFTQEIERALRTAAEQGDLTPAPPTIADGSAADDLAADDAAGDGSAADGSAADDLAADDLAADDLAADDLAADDLAADGSAADDLAADEPAAHDPAAHDPAADEPAADDLAADDPAADDPA